MNLQLFIPNIIIVCILIAILCVVALNSHKIKKITETLDTHIKDLDYVEKDIKNKYDILATNDENITKQI